MKQYDRKIGVWMKNEIKKTDYEEQRLNYRALTQRRKSLNLL